MDKENYINGRLEEQINWYSDRSQTNQRWFKSLRVIEIICAALIPFIAGMVDASPCGQIIIGALGIIIAICAGLSGLNKYQENWLIYRTTCETLKHEKFLFLTDSKPYGTDDSFNQLVERVESIISKENTQWSRSTNKRNK